MRRIQLRVAQSCPATLASERIGPDPDSQLAMHRGRDLQLRRVAYTHDTGCRRRRRSSGTVGVGEVRAALSLSRHGEPREALRHGLQLEQRREEDVDFRIRASWLVNPLHGSRRQDAHGDVLRDGGLAAAEAVTVRAKGASAKGVVGGEGVIVVVAIEGKACGTIASAAPATATKGGGEGRGGDRDGDGQDWSTVLLRQTNGGVRGMLRGSERTVQVC